MSYDHKHTGGAKFLIFLFSFSYFIVISLNNVCFRRLYYILVIVFNQIVTAETFCCFIIYMRRRDNN